MVGRKKLLAGMAAVVVLSVVCVAVFRSWRPQFGGPVNALAVDLSAPYAYVSTPSLSHLPRDIVKAPVVRDVLTQDFAFYYEEQEDRLSLDGAIKRIAYEHETTLSDRLIAAALDEPAELAWWPDAKGAPRYWLLAMTRGALATALQGMAGVAASDSQLSIIGTVRSNGSDVNAYALVLSPRRTLVLLSQGNRVVALSDPGLLFDTERHVDERALSVVAGLLSGDAAAQSAYRRGFGLEPQAPQGGSTLVADARLLSFGYQHFFPGVQALRFDIGADGASLNTALRVKAGNTLPATPGDRALWAALPADPAACTLLPVEWAQTEGLLAGAKPAATQADAAKEEVKPPDAAAMKAFTSQLEGPAAICWYARSQLHMPLFVARTRADAGPGLDATLAGLAHWAVPAKAQSTDTEAPPGVGLWQSLVDAPWGPYENDDARAYKPTLARQGRWIAFSPDDKLVELALKTQTQRYPGVADTLPSTGGATLAVGAPAQIADLLQREAFAVLPASQEVLRQAAQQHLVPRLDALRKLPPARAVARGAPDGNGWVAVDWQAMQPADAASTPRAK